ncbi:MAG: ABC transporter ATP-binding protein [Nitrosospira sp.]|nr:ABC transporter ATP-binding protein [Nitrosospira sp.]
MLSKILRRIFLRIPYMITHLLTNFQHLKRHPYAVWIGFIFIGIALLLLPFITEVTLGRSWVRILDFTLLYIMLALGLNIVVGFTGLLDLGYVAFFAVGAYLYALFASPHFDLHLPFWALLPLGALVTCIFGILLGSPTLRLRGDYLAIVTLGFGEIIRIFLNNLNTPINITNGPQGLNMIDPIKIADFSLNQTHKISSIVLVSVHNYYYLFLILALLIIFISIRLENSRIGRAWMAIREDEVAAECMGINTRNMKLLAFAMGASFGGISGGLFASFQGFVSPESFNLMESIMILCMVVLGGIGHIPGVILGAVLLSVLPEMLRYIGPLEQALFGRVIVDPADLRMLLFGLIMVLIMLLRPAGLWPSSSRRQDLNND